MLDDEQKIMLGHCTVEPSLQSYAAAALWKPGAHRAFTVKNDKWRPIMNIAKLAVLGTFLAPALAFGLNADQNDIVWKEKQEQQPREISEKKRAQSPDPSAMQQMHRGERMEHSRLMQQGVQNSGMEGDRHGFVTRPSGRVVSLDHLIGSTARGRVKGEDFGEVQDIYIDSNGQAVAAVISVGGFLGMGEKNVAVSWRQITVAPENDTDNETTRTMGSMSSAQNMDQNNDRSNAARNDGQAHEADSYVLTVDVTKESLEQAPEFERTLD